MSNCNHAKTHTESAFIDLEDDGSMSYDVYEICDNPECGEYWVVDEIFDNGEILAEGAGLRSKGET